METFFTPVAIFITTCAGFAVRFAWYSPFIFMKAWMKGEGLTEGSLPKRDRRYMMRVSLYSFIACGAMASVLAIMFEVLAVTSLSLAVSLGLLLTFGFIVTTQFIDMIYTTHGSHYEARSQYKFLIASGYYLVVMGVMSAVLFLVGVK